MALRRSTSGLPWRSVAFPSHPVLMAKTANGVHQRERIVCINAMAPFACPGGCHARIVAPTPFWAALSDVGLDIQRLLRRAQSRCGGYAVQRQNPRNGPELGSLVSSRGLCCHGQRLALHWSLRMACRRRLSAHGPSLAGSARPRSWPLRRRALRGRGFPWRYATKT